MTKVNIVAAFILVLSLATPSAAGPFEDGVANYKIRYYGVSAMKAWLPLADAGHAQAQANIGVTARDIASFRTGWLTVPGTKRTRSGGSLVRVHAVVDRIHENW